jgi:inward rectifier potassium channel
MSSTFMLSKLFDHFNQSTNQPFNHSTSQPPMALFNKNNHSKLNTDTGFSDSASNNTGRFLNRDGNFNVTREGIPFWSRISVYHTLLELSAFNFLAVTLLAILVMNVLFTSVYYVLGFENFTGFVQTGAWGELKELFFFSAQTFTTVGYGRVNPTGDAVNVVASIEAVTGFLSFAFITGMLYGRFARPRANLSFSTISVVAPYQTITAIMFRFAAAKDTHTLSDVEVKVNLGMQLMQDGKPVYKFYELPLERTHIENLPMNLTVVHPIDEQSPLWQMTAEDYERADVELYVLVRAFDDVYSSTVQQRTSYIYSEIKHGVKFAPMFRETEDGSKTILQMQFLSSTVEVSS